MRLLITGADGMIGHGVWRYFSQTTDHDVVASVRSARLLASFGEKPVAQTGDLDDADAVSDLMDRVRPDWVINCAGVTKHAESGDDAIKVIRANCLLPNLLANATAPIGARMIHISTDCVFLGTRGHYSETDVPDANDLYGRSKVLGEIADRAHVLTIRTSTIGFELASQRGLLEWFLAQRGRCRGFSRAIFSGVTSHELGRVLNEYVLGRDDLSGILHLAGPAIDKLSLLRAMKAHFAAPVEIDEDSSLVIDRSLDGSRFCALTGFKPRGWNDMLSELAEIGR